MKSIILFLLLVFIDQASKIMTSKFLQGSNPIQIIEGIFELTYVENRGIAFGMFSSREGANLIFIIFISIMVLAIFYFRYRLPETKKFAPLKMLIIFILAGAVGNLIDRIRLGYVIDMLHFYWFKFPVFNIADTYVVVGIVALLYLMMTRYRDYEF